jgi:hypothetical protein
LGSWIKTSKIKNKQFTTRMNVRKPINRVMFVF